MSSLPLCSRSNWLIDFDHLEGLSALPLDLMDQRQAGHRIAVSRDMRCKAIFEDLVKMPGGSFQLIAVIIYLAKKPVPPGSS